MKKQILVVDDQEGIRLLLHDIFTNEGYGVTTVGTGREALDKLLEKSFDLLMLDYMLPVMDGKKVLEQLQWKKIEIPSIVMTGLAENVSNKIKTFPMVKKVVSKPFDVRDVCQIVNSILQ